MMGSIRVLPKISESSKKIIAISHNTTLYDIISSRMKGSEGLTSVS